MVEYKIIKIIKHPELNNFDVVVDSEFNKELEYWTFPLKFYNETEIWKDRIEKALIRRYKESLQLPDQFDDEKIEALKGTHSLDSKIEEEEKMKSNAKLRHIKQMEDIEKINKLEEKLEARYFEAKNKEPQKP